MLNSRIITSRFSTRPLYLQVRDALGERISGGEWKPSTAIPNEGDLARQFGVSPGTMRRKALDLLESLHGAAIVLEDVDRGTAGADGRVVERIATLRGIGLTVTTTTDQRRRAEGRLRRGVDLHRRVHEHAPRPGGSRALRHRQSVGDTVGPGGIFRALRNVPVLVGIARDMQEQCPDARCATGSRWPSTCREEFGEPSAAPGGQWTARRPPGPRTGSSSSSSIASACCPRRATATSSSSSPASSPRSRAGASAGASQLTTIADRERWQAGHVAEFEAAGRGTRGLDACRRARWSRR